MDARPSVEDLALIFETVSDQILLLEVEGPEQLRIVSMNHTVLVFIRSYGNLIGQPLDVLAARDSAYFQACVRAAREQRTVQYVQHAQLDGRGVSIDIRLMPVVRDGRCTHVLSLGRDISHEQEIVRALQASERGLDATLRSIADAVITIDQDHRIVRMNTAAAQLLEATAGAAGGQSLDDVLRLSDPDSAEPLRCADIATLDVSREVRVATAPERAFTVTASPLRDALDDVGGAVLVLHDVTAERRAARERARVEERLRESEARYRVQFEHAPEAIVTFDVDSGSFVEANEVAVRMFGYSREELFRMNPAQLSAPVLPDGRVAREHVALMVGRALEGETPVFEWVHRSRDGREFPCEVRLVRLPGRGHLCRGSIVDITERKQAEELKRLSLTLMEQNRLIQAANHMKSAFVANMSHELRTPLNAILGFAELLHDDKVGACSAEQRDCLASILASGRHLLGLINGMLDLAKVESGRLDFAPEPTDLAAVIGEAVDVVRSLAVRKKATLTATIDGELGRGLVDPARLKQVLFNLLSNAIKFSHDGGRITVRARARGEDLIIIEVEDEGIGIREADLPRLFVEFSQLDAGLDKQYEGTGLGLVLTQRIVRAMGGDISVRSSWGKGSVFSVALPRSCARAPERATFAPAPAGSTPRGTADGTQGSGHGRGHVEGAHG